MSDISCENDNAAVACSEEVCSIDVNDIELGDIHHSEFGNAVGDEGQNASNESGSISFSSVEDEDYPIYDEEEPSTAEITEVQFSLTQSVLTPETSHSILKVDEEESENGGNVSINKNNGWEKKKKQPQNNKPQHMNKSKNNKGNSSSSDKNNIKNKNSFANQGQKNQNQNKKNNSNSNITNKKSTSTNNSCNNSGSSNKNSTNKSNNHSYNKSASNSYQNNSKTVVSNVGQNNNANTNNSYNACKSNTHSSNNSGNNSHSKNAANGSNTNNGGNNCSSNNKNNGGNSNNNNNNNNNNNKNNNGNKNEKNNKPNILKHVKGIIRQVRKDRQRKPDAVDSFILRMHYCLAVCVFLLAYNIVQGNWFLRESIHCVEAFNGDTLVSSHKKSICLSYPYTCEPPVATKFGNNECQHRYQLFYKWIHFSFLILSAVYYSPRILAKGRDHQLRKLLADLASYEQKYDNFSLEEGTKLALCYFKNHSFVHFPLYARMVFCHIYALVIDTATVLFFNFMLHDGFFGLIYATYPWNRNPSNFNDSLSHQFPPFAFCTIDKHNLINNARIENYGCHLMLMELYEKVFIVIWFLLVVLTLLTTISVFVLLVLWVPPFSWFLLRTSITSSEIQRVKRKVLKICGIGDLYTLYLLKRHMNERHFVLFLNHLVETQEYPLKEVFVDS